MAAHSALIVHRCRVLGDAMLAARSGVAEGRADAAVQRIALPAARGCKGITVTYTAAGARDGGGPSWHIEFEGVRRSVVLALTTYLYGDTLEHVPAHRVPQLRLLAEALHLRHLVFQCDRLMHAYDEDVAAGVVATLPAAGPAPAPAAPVASATAAAAAAGAGAGAGTGEKESTWGSDMLLALTGGRLADVTLVVPGGGDGGDGAPAVHHLHRVVLTRCDYFNRLLLGDFDEGGAGGGGAGGGSAAHRTVVLSDVDATALADVLAFMYAGDVSALTRDGGRCMAALALASRWCLPDLVRQAQDIVTQRMAPEDAAICHHFALQYDLPRLARFAAQLLRTAGADAGEAAGGSGGGAAAVAAR